MVIILSFYYVEYDLGKRDQEFDETMKPMVINGDVISEIESFKCLGPYVQKGLWHSCKTWEGGWVKWRRAFYVIKEFH